MSDKNSLKDEYLKFLKNSNLSETKLQNSELLNEQYRQTYGHDFEIPPIENSFNWILSNYCEDIRNSILNAGKNFDVPIFAGEYPTCEFNAYYARTNKGHIFLLNTGLFVFLNQFTKLLSHLHCHINYDKNNNAFIDRFFINTQLSFDECISLLSDSFIEYEKNNIPLLSRNIPISIDKKADILRSIFLSHMEKFILMHEFMHAIAGHLTAKELKNESTEGDLTIFEKMQNQEFEADQLAVSWMISLDLFPHLKFDEGYEYHKYAYIFHAVNIFFYLLNIKEDVYQMIVGEKISFSTHPPAWQRFMNITKHVLKEYKNHPMDIHSILLSSLYQTASWMDLVSPILYESLNDKVRKLS